LSRTYRTSDVVVEALRGVDLDVAAGEFLAVMGRSGSGKSTLLHLLGGLDRPTGGEIHLCGRRVDRLSETRWAVLRRRQVGFVFQSYNLIGNLSVADNVELPALLVGIRPVEARRLRAALVEELDLAGRARLVPGRLSGGEQQRVALARALINRPAVLLADEPTGSLDTASGKVVMGLLQRAHRAGQTIVLVTHDARVASTADRVVTMRDGQIVADADLDAALGR
jgi:putative ABC transport system ATP-binding protein